MRLVTLRTAEGSRWGVRDGADVHLAPREPGVPETLLEALGSGYLEDRLHTEGPTGWTTISLAQATLDAPLPQPPRNIICLGLNYADHARESQRAKGKDLELPEHPVVFTKATTTVSGPGDDIVLDPRVTGQFDWEVELAVVIGRGGRHIPADRALAHVAGWTVVNDLSARDLQFQHKQFFMGKSVDGSCPMGPELVTVDELPEAGDLTLRCSVNGTVKQEASTAAMIFPVPEIIARLSRVMTLIPGDVIATGTPSGVGFAREPPEFLEPGDVVRSEIEPLGALENRIVSP